MSRLKNPKHEAFARKYSTQITNKTMKPGAGEIYSQVYGTAVDSSISAGSRLLQNVDVRNRILEIVGKDVPIELLSRRLKQQLNARKAIYHEGRKVGAEPDNSARGHALEVGFKLHGGIGPNSVTAVDARQVHYNFQPTSEDLAHMDRVVTKLSELTRQMGQFEATVQGDESSD